MRSVYPLGRLRDNRRRPPRPRRSRADRRRSAAAPCARQAPLADANSRDSSVANATNAVSPRGLHAAWQQRPAIRRRQPRPRSSPKHRSLASRFSCRNLATLCEDAPPVAVRTVTSRFGEGDRRPSDAKEFRKSDVAGGGKACGLSLGQRRSRKKSARGNEGQSVRSFNQGARWAVIDRMPGRLKRSLKDAWRGFVA